MTALPSPQTCTADDDLARPTPKAEANLEPAVPLFSAMVLRILKWRILLELDPRIETIADSAYSSAFREVIEHRPGATLWPGAPSAL